MKKIIKILLGIIIGSGIMILFAIFIYKYFQHDIDYRSGRILQKVYISDLGGGYQLGKTYDGNNICNIDRKIGCINGELKGIKITNEKDFYLLFYLWRRPSYLTNLDGKTIIDDYSYTIFHDVTSINYKIETIKTENEIPKYALLSNGKLEFYSEKDLEKLTVEQKNIFKELEKNPTIIINGVDYSAKK